MGSLEILLRVVISLLIGFSILSVKSETAVEESSYNEEERLMEKILNNNRRKSSILARPVRNSSDTVQVNFQINIVHLLDFDEKNQVISILIWKEYTWTNPFLAWDPDEFGSLKRLLVPSNAVWTPDIVLYNSVNPDPRFDGRGKGNEDLVLHFNGTTKWVPVVKVNVPCTLNMRDFPFDSQQCFLKYGSWAHTEDKINLTNNGEVTYDEYASNMEWEIIDSHGARIPMHYGCCGNETFIILYFSFTLTRNSGFYAMFLLLPICMLSVMVLTIFWIPPHRPDRTGLGMSLFGSFMVLILVIVQLTPPTTTSQLGIYCCLNTVMIAFATVLSAAMVNIAKKKTPFPDILTVFLYPCNQWKLHQPHNAINSKRHQPRNDKDTNPVYVGTSNQESPTKRATHGANINQCKWEQFAHCLDRLFFICYLIIFAIFFFLNIVTLFAGCRQSEDENKD